MADKRDEIPEEEILEEGRSRSAQSAERKKQDPTKERSESREQSGDDDDPPGPRAAAGLR
ncbi:hypothetical protein [Streptomyces sp. Ru73]|uniref:hypothetical protein n=1 Tax=Streptomyces sp. Ru73 TaxID=2080748 RepID=UPI0011B03B25|nr:hypothetical protein [Streptomyces sp. Ru73]